MREYLKNSEVIATVDPHSRLAGSYARHTAVGDIKDVDIILIVDPKYESDKPKVVLEALAEALEGLPEALGDSGNVELRKQRRSVHVYFTEEDFHLDIVPALIPDSIDEPVLVPDREWQEWIPSHPFGYQKFLSELNQANNNRVVPLIKLLKHWRDVHMKIRRPKSYWLECLVVRHITKGWVQPKGSYAEIFADLLDSIYDRFKEHLDKPDSVPRIPDPMLKHNVAFNWERSHFETFMRRVDESRKWARQALEDDIEVDEAVKLWRKVFGELFPESVEEAAKSLAHAIQSGAKVGPTGRILLGHTDSPGVSIPKHRFYGSAQE